MLRETCYQSFVLPIYLDNNATTPVDPRVFESMRPYLTEHFGNPASRHRYGWKAQMAVDTARKQVADLLGTPAGSVVWTSGATESNNLAILGLLEFFQESEAHPHFITDVAEHKAVLEVFELARKRGAEITLLPVTADGLVDPQLLQNSIRGNTRLISVMAANNEIGSLNPLAEISEVCASRGIVFHTDAAQAVGRLPLRLTELKIDLLSLSSHKLYGPKGAGALISRPVNRAFELRPLMVGGTQEHSLRPGTLNVPGIVGLGRACAILHEEMQTECEKQWSWQNQLIEAFAGQQGVYLNGPRKNRLCNNVNFSFASIRPSDILTGLNDIAFSAGSACAEGETTASHVLKAIGRDDSLAKSTIRFGFGRFNTDRDIEMAIERLQRLFD